MAGGVGVGGVGVVEQRRGEERGEEEDEPEAGEDEQSGRSGAERRCRVWLRLGGAGFEEGWVDHELLCSSSINGLDGSSLDGRQDACR